MLSTERRRHLAALGLFVLLAGWLLRDGLRPGHVLISSEALRKSLPWSAVLPAQPPHNRFLVDQTRIYWPYLVEAARVYDGEASALWTSRAGGGLPFLGNITSSLLHPLTLLAAFLPLHVVPLLQGLLVLVLSAFFTWLFLRRMGLSVPASLLGAVGFGFGGHQVLWLQYALSHTLVALPLAFWATERVVERRSARRVVVLAVAFALLVLAGHPETGYVAGLVAGLWALYRLWDSHGRVLVLLAGLLALALSAVQWMPFLEYALASHGSWLREQEAALHGAEVSFGAAAVYGVLFLGAVALLRSVAGRGLGKLLLAVLACSAALVMARRMGLAVAGGVLVLPEMYGNPVGGARFTGAQDFPGLNAGYVGALPPLLLGLGFFVGMGRGFVRFFGVVALLLWGAAFGMPALENLVRAVPGLHQVASTRLLGPVGFCTACGAAMVLDRLARGAKPGVLDGMARVATTVTVALAVSILVLRLPTDPHGGRTIVSKLESPRNHRRHHGGDEIVPVSMHLPRPVDALRVRLDGRLLHDGPVPASPPGGLTTVPVGTHREEEGLHTLHVEVERDGAVEVLASQPFVVRRDRQLSFRDALALGAALAALVLLMRGQGPRAPWLLAGLVSLDVLSLGAGYNRGSPADELFPPTRTTDFLAAQEPPFRIFTEGTILPPDTQFVPGVDHLLGYDNLGYQTFYRLLLAVPLDMSAFPRFSFSRESAAYGSPRFDLLDVRYVLTAPGEDLSDVPGFRLVHESETRVWENGGNLGRAWLVEEALDGRTLSVAEAAPLDYSRVALLEQAPPLPLGGRGTARVTSHRGDEIVVATDADGPALLVVAENHAPGWRASVDGGEPAPTLRADVAWQAVPVPAGQHEIVLTYRPASYRWGLWLSLVAAATASAFVVGTRRRRR